MDQVKYPDFRRLKIAVIGTGIAGMATAWLLNQHHKVTVYEKNKWVGGHANTVDVLESSSCTPVDTGFIVYNETSYPNLVALFNYLNVPTKNSEMSFAASLENSSFEYSGTDLNGLIGQRRNIVRPRFWNMMKDVLRFYKIAPEWLEKNDDNSLCLGQFLRDNNFSKSFIHDHLLPMGAAIWSTTALDMQSYPARAFLNFFQSHGLLLLRDRPQWRTVDGGSRSYVKRLTADYVDQIRKTRVTRVLRWPDKVIVEDCSGDTATYDYAVLAVHADEALAILSDPDHQETGILGNWRYTHNRAVLHTDASFMPKRRRIWSSWNFIEHANQDPNQPANEHSFCVTYWMNKLQSLESTSPLFVTLNPPHEPATDKIICEFDYTHPCFDHIALTSQQQLWSLQGHRRIWYCGSYFGYGFHEDALQAGLAVAEELGGVQRPWSVANENGRICTERQTG